MQPKPNDILICYNNTHHAIFFTKNKKYKVKYTGHTPNSKLKIIILTTDKHGDIFFTITEDDIFNYKRYFYTIKEYRKLKMSKLLQNEYNS